MKSQGAGGQNGEAAVLPTRRGRQDMVGPSSTKARDYRMNVHELAKEGLAGKLHRFAPAMSV